MRNGDQVFNPTNTYISLLLRLIEQEIYVLVGLKLEVAGLIRRLGDTSASRMLCYAGLPH